MSLHVLSHSAKQGFFYIARLMELEITMNRAEGAFVCVLKYNKLTDSDGQIRVTSCEEAQCLDRPLVN